MARREKQAEPLPTIWRVDDALWARAEKVLAEFDPRRGSARNGSTSARP